MYFLYLLFPAIVYSFSNLPVHLYSKNIKGIKNIKIIEPSNVDKSEKYPAFIFFTGLRGNIPHEIYNNFLTNVASTGISCFIFNEDIHKSKNIIEHIGNSYSNITISGHSSGASKAIKLYNECKDINNIILFDPVDDRILEKNKFEFIYNNFFDKDKNKYNIDNVKNYLLVKAEDSYKWNIFPPKLPFIPLFQIDEKILNINDNTYIIDNTEEEYNDKQKDFIKITRTVSKKIKPNKKVIKIKDFGHMDILDDYWSKLMFKILRGDDKNINELSSYHKFNAYLVNQICYDNLNNIKTNMDNNDKISNIKFKTNDI